MTIRDVLMPPPISIFRNGFRVETRLRVVGQLDLALLVDRYSRHRFALAWT
jgi:hypothetical protein